MHACVPIRAVSIAYRACTSAPVRVSIDIRCSRERERLPWSSFCGFAVILYLDRIDRERDNRTGWHRFRRRLTLMSPRRRLRVSLRKQRTLYFRLLCLLLASQFEASRVNTRQTISRTCPMFSFWQNCWCEATPLNIESVPIIEF